MLSFVYDGKGERVWGGSVDHCYRLVKHHMDDGYYIVRNADASRYELVCRANGIVFPLARSRWNPGSSQEGVEDDGDLIRRLLDDARVAARIYWHGESKISWVTI